MLTPRQQSLAGALLAWSGGLIVGWALWHPKDRVVETPAVEVRNRDSSLTLERRPDASARPSHERPPGVLERIVRLTVKGDPYPVTDTLWLPAREDSVPRGTTPPSEPIIHTVMVQPPPLEVELSLVRGADQMRRVTASVKGGKVIGGIDIPIESAAPERHLRWAAGPTWSPLQRTWGAAVTREVGPINLLGSVEQGRPRVAGDGFIETGFTARVGVLIRW